MNELIPELRSQYKQLQDTKSEETKDTTLEIKLILKRRKLNPSTVEANPKYGLEKFYSAEDLLELPYKKLLSYTSQLSEKNLSQLYGADPDSIRDVAKFLRINGAKNIVKTNARSERTITFMIRSDQFLSTFTNGKIALAAPSKSIFPENSFPSNYFPYISKRGPSDSFLRAQGPGAKAFAKSILGITFIEGASDENAIIENDIDPEAPLSSREPSKFFPIEIAKAYNFPGLSDDRSGEGVRIGLTGTGGNQAMLNWQRDPDFNDYLIKQGRNPNAVPQIESLNPDAPDDASPDEQMLDISVLTSIAPGAQIIASSEDAGSDNEATLYSSYASLIYLKGSESVDIISSSGSNGIWDSYISAALDELFLDAVLRGITIVKSAGDRGTGNPISGGPLVKGLGSSEPLLNSGSAAVLSVGGTAFNKDGITQKNGEESLIATPNSQSTWNERIAYGTLREALGQKLNEQIADPVTGSFRIEIANDYIQSGIWDAPLVATIGEAYFDAEQGLYQGLASSGVFTKSSGYYGAGYQHDNLNGKWKKTWRRYPDISMLSGGNAANGAGLQGYIISQWTDQGYIQGAAQGTSAATPLIAGLLAIATSKLKEQYGKEARLGFINPFLYELYNSAAQEKVFFDVPAGSNNANLYYTPRKPQDWDGIYVAYDVNKAESSISLYPLNGTGDGGVLDSHISATRAGFDAATGLGSLNGMAFVDQLLTSYFNS